MENKWDLLPQEKRQSEKIFSKPSTYFNDVVHRLVANKLAIISLIIIILLVIISLIGPSLSKHTYFDQDLAYVNIPPVLNCFEVNGKNYYLTPSFTVIEVSQDGMLLEAQRIDTEDLTKKVYYYEDENIIVSFAEKPATMISADGVKLSPTKSIFNKDYIFGTDMMGRDMFVRVLYGARISLMVAFIAAIVNFLIGVLYGGISGYVGGNVDIVMMRIVDIISTIPLTLYVILIMVVIGSTGFISIVIALGSVYWVGMARIVRGQVLSLKQQEFVFAARTIGTPPLKILLKHLIPNAMGSIIVTVTMLIPSAIFTESFLSFIGLGISAPMASWGTLCSDALEGLRISPYQMIIPAAAICLTMFCFNFLGDGMRTALDPKTKSN